MAIVLPGATHAPGSRCQQASHPFVALDMNRTRQPNRQTRKRQTGQMGIIGALLGLVILGLVLAYVGRKFLDANSNSKTQTAAENTKALIVNAQQTYAHVPTRFAGVTAPALINNGAVPEANVNGVNIVSSFGTPVAVTAQTYYQPNDSIQLSFGVPAANCAAFAQAIADYVSVLNIGGSQVKNIQTGLVATPTNIAPRCAAGGATVPFALVATL